jgi:hypothetical protein
VFSLPIIKFYVAANLMLFCNPRFRSPVYVHLEELRPDTEIQETPFRWPTPPPPEPFPPKWEVLNPPLRPIPIQEPTLYSPLEPLPEPCTSVEHLVSSVEVQHALIPIVTPSQTIVRASKPSPLTINVEEKYAEDVIRFGGLERVFLSG